MALEKQAEDDTGTRGAAAGNGMEDDERVFLLWPSRVKLLLNSHVWFSVIVGFGAACLILAVIVGFASGSAQAGLIAGGGGLAFFLAVFIVTGIFVDLFGGFRVTFLLTSRGVRSVRGEGGNAVSKAAAIGGLMTGSTAALGAGLLAESERNVFIAYPDVRKVKALSSGTYILVRGRFGAKPIGLYCTRDLSGKALEMLKQRCPGARFL